MFALKINISATLKLFIHRGKEEKRRKQRKSKQKQAGRGEDRSRYPPRSDLHF